jgi:hypothetical protein|nr:MAG TPA_asm: hypothetical protein [Caudoviricetes sp.]
MRKWIVGCVLVCSLCLNVVLCCENGRGRIEGRIKTDTAKVTVVDTVTYTLPVAKDSVVVKYVTKKLPIVRDTVHYTHTDTVRIRLPVTQRRYEDSTYTAWVSGYEPTLDSIRVYSHREIMTVTNRLRDKPRRISLNLNVGYGITPKGTQPYIGFGVGYRLLSL